MNAEDLARILALLSPGKEEEGGRRYNDLRDKLAGYFSFKGISDPFTAADETIDRTVTKINAGTDIPDIGKYCFGIARNIAKEKQRLMYRESVAVQQFTETVDDFPLEQVERIQGTLKPCFEELSAEEQQLLVTYCREIHGRGRAEHRRQLAEEMQISVLALRIRVARLRSRLAECVGNRSNHVGSNSVVSNKTRIWSIFM